MTNFTKGMRVQVKEGADVHPWFERATGTVQADPYDPNYVSVKVDGEIVDWTLFTPESLEVIDSRSIKNPHYHIRENDPDYSPTDQSQNMCVATFEEAVTYAKNRKGELLQDGYLVNGNITTDWQYIITDPDTGDVTVLVIDESTEDCEEQR